MLARRRAVPWIPCAAHSLCSCSPVARRSWRSRRPGPHPTTRRRRTRPSSPGAASSRSRSPVRHPGRRCGSSPPTGTSVRRGTSDATGALLLRDVPPGAGYRVEEPGGARSAPLRVLAEDEHPPHGFYASQHLGPGYQYLTTRDGTQLAVNVRLPGPPDAGPYPTVVEYSGYDPANPDGNQAAMRLAQILGVRDRRREHAWHRMLGRRMGLLRAAPGARRLRRDRGRSRPSRGSRTAGSGWSGSPTPGITQLFVAATRPPHLAAITPLSVIADTYRGVLYPGGILNTGFAVPWAEDRQSDAEPRAGGRPGVGEATRRGGRRDVRGQPGAARADPRRARRDRAERATTDPTVSTTRRRRSSSTASTSRPSWPARGRTSRPAGTGPTLIDHFAPQRAAEGDGHQRDARRAVRARRDHPLGRVPRLLRRPPGAAHPARHARRTRPPATPRSRACRSTLPPDRFTGETDFDAALARYQAEPPIRVLFDNGAGGATRARPSPRSRRRSTAWPPPNATARSLYLGPDGALGTQRPRRLAAPTPTATTRRRCPGRTIRRRTTTSSTRSLPTTGSRCPTD